MVKKMSRKEKEIESAVSLARPKIYGQCDSFFHGDQIIWYYAAGGVGSGGFRHSEREMIMAQGYLLQALVADMTDIYQALNIGLIKNSNETEIILKKWSDRRDAEREKREARKLKKKEANNE